jgi:hypothetical protein
MYGTVGRPIGNNVMATRTQEHGPGVVDWAPDHLRQNPLRSEFDPTAVAEDKLRRDVAELLFKDAKYSTTWDALGSPPVGDRAGFGGGRHVTIDPKPTIVEDRIDFVDLPVGLGLLFDVATMEEFENPHRRLTELALGSVHEFGHSRATSIRAPSTHAASEDREGDARSTKSDASAARKAADQAETTSAKSAKSGKVSEKSAASHRSAKKASQNVAGGDAPAGDGDTHRDEPEAQEPDAPLPEPIDPAEATARIRLKGPPEYLVYLLMLAASPPSVTDHCVRLYEVGLERQAKVRAADLARAEAIRKSEDKECTFRPNIGKSKELPGRGGIQNFYASTVEWKKQAQRKLAKKATQEQTMKHDETYVPWKMNERSREIIQARRHTHGGPARSVSTANSAAGGGEANDDVDGETIARSASQFSAMHIAARDALPSRATRAADTEFFQAVFSPTTNHKQEKVYSNYGPKAAASPAPGATTAKKNRSDSASGATNDAPSPVPLRPLDGTPDGNEHEQRPDENRDGAEGGRGDDQAERQPAEGQPAEGNCTEEHADQAKEGEEEADGEAQQQHQATNGGGDEDEDEDDEEPQADEDRLYPKEDFGDRIVLLDYPYVGRKRDEQNTSRNGGVEDPADVIERMEHDIKERRARRETRADLFQQKQREKLFDKATGQPLFEPNAMPAAHRHGKLVNLEDLTPAERQDLYAQVRRQYRIDLQAAVSIAKRRLSTGKERRSMQDIVENLMMKQTMADKKVAKTIRKQNQELEQQFKPKINERPGGPDPLYIPVHRRPLPARKPTQKKEAQVLFKCSADNMAHVLQRSTQFEEARARKLARVRSSRDREEVAECTGHPTINPVSAILVEKLQGRTMQQIDMYEEMEAEHRRSKSTLHEMYELPHAHPSRGSLQALPRKSGSVVPPPPPPPPQTALGALKRPRVTSGQISRPRTSASPGYGFDPIPSTHHHRHHHPLDNPYHSDPHQLPASQHDRFQLPLRELGSQDYAGGYGGHVGAPRGAAPQGVLRSTASAQFGALADAALPAPPLDTDALVDELLSVGRLRAPTNEPAIPSGLAAAQRRAEEARTRRAAADAGQPNLLRVFGDDLDYVAIPSGAASGADASPTSADDLIPQLLGAPRVGPSGSYTAYASSLVGRDDFGFATRPSSVPHDLHGSPTLERLSAMDEEAIKLLTSPNPLDPRRGATRGREERPIGAGVPQQPQARNGFAPVAAHVPPLPAARSGRVASGSVDDVLNDWQQLDAISRQVFEEVDL